jgi:hypothetical protein
MRHAPREIAAASERGSSAHRPRVLGRVQILALTTATMIAFAASSLALGQRRIPGGPRRGDPSVAIRGP